MEALPIEILVDEIGKHLDIWSNTVYRYVLTSSLLFRKNVLVPVLPDKYSNDFYRYSCQFVQIFWRRIRKTICDRVAAVGNLELLKWAVQPKYFRCSWLGETAECEYSSVENAVRSGNVAILEWILNLSERDVISPEFAIIAAGCGHVEMFKYLNKFGTAEIWRCMDAAIDNGHLEMVKYLNIYHGAIVNLVYASARGHLNILKYYGHGGDAIIFQHALERANPEMIQWLIDTGCPMPENVDWISGPNLIHFPELQKQIRFVGCPCLDWIMAHNDIVALRHVLSINEYSYIHDTDVLMKADLAMIILFEKTELSCTIEDVISYDRIDILQHYNLKLESKHICSVLSMKTLDYLLSLPFTKNDEHLLTAAIKFRKLDLLIELKSRGVIIPLREVALYAITNNRIDILETVIMWGFELVSDAAKYAVDLEMLRYIVAHAGLHPEVGCWMAAAGHLDMLQWALSSVDLDGSLKLAVSWDGIQKVAEERCKTNILRWIDTKKGL